jgi:predicted Zn finger-like uncharacterized protein
MIKVKVTGNLTEQAMKKALAQQVAQQELEGPCPGCGTKYRVKGVDVAAGRTITCSGCGNTITMNDKDGTFGRAIRGQ